MMQRLKIDEATAERTYKFAVPENKAFRGEGAIDVAGLSEMIRLLAADQMIPKREPWETFVDPFSDHKTISLKFSSGLSAMEV